jgi:hypothetical protein
MKKWLSPKFDERHWMGKRFCLYKTAEELNEFAAEILKFANKGPYIKQHKREKIKSEFCDVERHLEKVWELLEEYE